MAECGRRTCRQSPWCCVRSLACFTRTGVNDRKDHRDAIRGQHTKYPYSRACRSLPRRKKWHCGGQDLRIHVQVPARMSMLLWFCDRVMDSRVWARRCGSAGRCTLPLAMTWRILGVLGSPPASRPFAPSLSRPSILPGSFEGPQHGIGRALHSINVRDSLQVENATQHGGTAKVLCTCRGVVPYSPPPSPGLASDARPFNLEALRGVSGPLCRCEI